MMQFKLKSLPIPPVDPLAFKIGIAAIAAEIIERRREKLVGSENVSLSQPTTPQAVAA